MFQLKCVWKKITTYPFWLDSIGMKRDLSTQKPTQNQLFLVPAPIQRRDLHSSFVATRYWHYIVTIGLRLRVQLQSVRSWDQPGAPAASGSREDQLQSGDLNFFTVFFVFFFFLTATFLKGQNLQTTDLWTSSISLYFWYVSYVNYFDDTYIESKKHMHTCLDCTQNFMMLLPLRSRPKVHKASKKKEKLRLECLEQHCNAILEDVLKCVKFTYFKPLNLRILRKSCVLIGR